jgi:hypothetical protein
MFTAKLMIIKRKNIIAQKELVKGYSGYGLYIEEEPDFDEK